MNIANCCSIGPQKFVVKGKGKEKEVVTELTGTGVRERVVEYIAALLRNRAKARNVADRKVFTAGKAREVVQSDHIEVARAVKEATITMDHQSASRNITGSRRHITLAKDQEVATEEIV